ncbi:hypothetical protein BHM03_00045416 [Ensete ventricosum]|nr:hypothetical protein BHM03_00045416 [Ensete ventricosum]
MLTIRRGSSGTKVKRWQQGGATAGVHLKMAAAVRTTAAREEAVVSWQRLSGGDEEEEIKAAAEEGLAVVEAAGKKRREQRGLVRAAEQVRQRRAWPRRQAVGRRHRRKQWVAMVRTWLEASAVAAIFLEEVTRAAVAKVGGRDWEQKAGVAGERQHDLVWAAREGRKMARMASSGGREEGNRGGRQRKRQSKERRKGRVAWAEMADDNGREERQQQSGKRATAMWLGNGTGNEVAGNK